MTQAEWTPPRIIWILSPVELTRREQYVIRRLREGYSIPDRNAVWLERKGLVRKIEEWPFVALTELGASIFTEDASSPLFAERRFQYPSGEP